MSNDESVARRPPSAGAWLLLGSRADAKVVQDAFLTAQRTAATFDSPKGSTRSWLLTLVRLHAINVP